MKSGNNNFKKIMKIEETKKRRNEETKKRRNEKNKKKSNTQI